jgi:hypothetical protein
MQTPRKAQNHRTRGRSDRTSVVRMVRTDYLIPGRPTHPWRAGEIPERARGSGGGSPDSRRASPLLGWGHDTAAARSGRSAPQAGLVIGSARAATAPEDGGRVRAAAGRAAGRGRGNVLRGPERHGGKRHRRRGQRRPACRLRALGGSLRRARRAGPRAPGRRRGPGAQHHLHLGSLAGHRRGPRLAGVASARRLPRLPQRPAAVWAGGDADRGDVPRRATATHGPGLPRHRDHALGGVPRPPAAVVHEPVRRDAELPRRVGPARRHRAGPGEWPRLAAGRGVRTARPDAGHGGGDGQPLPGRRGGGRLHRAGVTGAGDMAPSEP